MGLSQRYEEQRARLEAHGQGHLLAFWNQLDDQRRAQLLDDLDAVDLDLCTPLLDVYVRNRPDVSLPERLEPPNAFPADPSHDLAESYSAARREGVEAIQAGRVAAFTVAGGQGTRLGYDGPKGGYAITPIRNAPLFQVFAEYLLGVERRYGTRCRWYIMTSPGNHSQTIAIFEQADWFGLRPDDVMFFPQGQMPAFLPDGRIAMTDSHRLALSPDGHGGSLRALAESGALADMRSRGIEQISYFQVDNPLVRCIDPLFIGLHIREQSEMSSKAVSKADDLERVGNFCMADGVLRVIEYSDLPESAARARNADGSRMLDAGSIAIHVLRRDFVERLTARDSGVRLPWHRADKKVAVVDERGERVEPSGPNVVKLEMFVFDAIPLAKRPLLLMTRREEEFSPVKNAEGVDSPATARRDLVERAGRWLELAGARLPRDQNGRIDALLEISPAFALDAEDLAERLSGGKQGIEPGGRLLLS